MMNRMANWFGLAGAVVVVLPVVLADHLETNGPIGVWWVAYGVFVAAFAFDMWRPPRVLPWLTDPRILAVVATSAVVAYFVYPLGVTAVLLIISAVFAANVLSSSGTWNLLAAQLVVIGVGMWLATESVAEVIIYVVVFGAFQAFAATMVLNHRKEENARQELAKTHAELRASTAMLEENSRTSERVRIARDLHDVVGHQLTALSLELEVASHQASGEAREHVLRARGIAKDLLSDVREAVGELRLHTPGLERPLRAFVEGVSKLDVELTVREDVDVDEHVAMTVLRCVQEIVTNTLRHADATTLRIDVAAGRDGVTVTADDDGRGADTVVAGNGITGMRERVEACGGKLAVRSGAGEGFAVTTWVPVA